MSSLSRLSSILREHAVHTQLSRHSTSSLLYAKPEKMLSAQTQKKGQLMNRLPLCSRSKPLYTAPANHQQPLYGFMSTGNISCAEPTQCSFCLQQRGLRVALHRKLRMYVQSGFSKAHILQAAVGAGRCFHVRRCTDDCELCLCLYSLSHCPLSCRVIRGATCERMFTHLYRNERSVSTDCAGVFSFNIKMPLWFKHLTLGKPCLSGYFSRSKFSPGHGWFFFFEVCFSFFPGCSEGPCSSSSQRFKPAVHVLPNSTNRSQYNYFSYFCITPSSVPGFTVSAEIAGRLTMCSADTQGSRPVRLGSGLVGRCQRQDLRC